MSRKLLKAINESIQKYGAYSIPYLKKQTNLSCQSIVQAIKKWENEKYKLS